ncbi:MAG: DUF4040 domain-containing protein, partial [Alphaproteobacteria bacterium]
AMQGVIAGSRTLLSWLGPTRQQSQLRILVLTTIVAGSLVAIGAGASLSAFDGRIAGADPVFAALWVVAACCALGAAQQAKFHRLAAVVLLSGTGFVTCITFLWLSAPDLALTQLLVEVVTTVLLLLGLRWLPKRAQGIHSTNAGALLRARLRRGLDFVIALVAGLAVTGISFLVMTSPAPETISSFFLDKSYTEAGGRNVVNVLLVDFRAFDTLGEITVLGIVGLTIFALLRRFRPAAESLSAPEQQTRQRVFDERHEARTSDETIVDYLMIPRVIMQWLFPVIVVFAIHLFLRGHDLPGGGFIAGITMSIAFILQYMASGTRWVETRLRILPLRWIGIGLLISAITGVASILFGYPFLTTSFQYVELPVLGKIPLASALIFDFGVFVLVVGATVLMLIALAHQSIRAPRVIETASDAEQEADAEPAPERDDVVPAEEGAR